MWHAAVVPWIPELFSAPALERVLGKMRRERLVAVPYFAGLVAGEPDALIQSFAETPELHHPVRGRVKGAGAFERFVIETNRWIARRNVSLRDVDVVVTGHRTVEEVVLHLDGGSGRVELPVAVVADRVDNGQSALKRATPRRPNRRLWSDRKPIRMRDQTAVERDRHTGPARFPSIRHCRSQPGEVQ